MKAKHKWNPLLVAGLVLLIIFACKNGQDQEEDSSTSTNSKSQKITSRDIEQLQYTEFALSDLAESATKDWLKFHELQSQIEILKKGDLSFFREEKAILVSLITDLKNEIPEAVQTSSIEVRLSVLETVMFKLEGLASLERVKKDVLLRAINGVLISNSNLIFQINKKFEKDSQNIQKPG